jgi:hypothetical protein
MCSFGDWLPPDGEDFTRKNPKGEIVCQAQNQKEWHHKKGLCGRLMFGSDLLRLLILVSFFFVV